MTKAERYPEAELVLDDELVYDDNPRRSAFLRREERPEDIVREGEVLAGKYRVERIPGRNGLGVLVQVRHMELGQEVTLKFLVPEACAYPEFVQRFVREARAAVRIQGEHVARVTDVGRLESGAPYMVREFLRGPDLAEVLKVRGALPIEEAVDYIIQACEGVAEGHALGVVHRNLRPTSLVVARRSDGTPLVKVFDFAASESLHVNPFTERAVSLVGTSAIMASLPYLAPEQIRDPHDVDYRADVYSLGAILFELLAGSPVYAAEAAPALLAQVAADPAPALRTLRSDAPAELDHIVLRCLAKNRAIRYPSVAELVLALRHFGSAESAASVEHIVRLGKRTSKLPELSEGRLPSPLPPAPVPSVVPQSQPAPARGRHGTVLMHTAQAVATQSIPVGRASVHDDVTTINPYASYAAPVVITPADHPRSEPRFESPPRYESLTRTEPLPAVRLTPQPPPLRASAPPPLTPPPLAAPPAISAPPLSRPPQSAPPPLSAQPPSSARVDSTSLPPAPRSSISGGLTRSWAVPDEPPAPLFSQKRLAIAAIAACATLGAVFATRAQHGAVAAAAAAPPVAAPARVEAPPPVAAPVTPPVEAPAVASAAATPAAPAAPAAPIAAVAPAPAAPAVAAPARPALAPVVAAPARPPAPVAAAAPAARAPAAPLARRPAAEAPLETPRKPAAAAEQKVASSRPASGGDMFDNPR